MDSFTALGSPSVSKRPTVELGSTPQIALAISRRPAFCLAIVFWIVLFAHPTYIGAQDDPDIPRIGPIDIMPSLFFTSTSLGGGDEIVLGAAYGLNLAVIESAQVLGDSSIENGINIDELIKRIRINRAIGDQFFLEIDYDVERDSLGFSGLDGNIYSARYQGLEYDVLRGASLGNRYLSIPGSRFLTIDEGSADSFALTGSLGYRNFGADALLRYDVSLSGTKRFRGNRQVVDLKVADTEYAKGVFFFLPDSNIELDSFELFAEKSDATDLLLDTGSFKRLSRDVDYTFDNGRGWIFLARSLKPDEELLAYYKKNSYSVGSSVIGRNSFIGEDGNRKSFDTVSYPDYFVEKNGITYLYLRKDRVNSYWELRNGYRLMDITDVSLPEDIEVNVVDEATEGINLSYEGIASQTVIIPEAGAIFFELKDTVGLFYPRPFPGEYPYGHDTNPINPFDPGNAIYGGIGYPARSASINTLHISYTLSSDSFFLDFDIVDGSVKVYIDGIELNPKKYSVDPVSGVIFFVPGVIQPSSDLRVTYKYKPFGGSREELITAVGVGYESSWWSIRNLLKFSYPLTDIKAPTVGEERPAVFGDSLEFVASVGAEEEEAGPYARLELSGAVTVENSNSAGVLRIASMNTENRFGISVYDSVWQIASPSKILEDAGVSISQRADLLFENYYEQSMLSGALLRELSWDNSENRSFTYGDKAGPYNVADAPAGRSGPSLVIDYAVPAGASEPFASLATAFPLKNLGIFDRMNIEFKAQDIAGGTVAVYLELLSIIQEDLNANNALDGESSAEQPGFSITPLGGVQTILGTDRIGDGNNEIDSEDLNTNGVLDPVGPFVSDSEAGVILSAEVAAAPSFEIQEGQSDWQRVSFSIRDIVAANPLVFQSAEAFRITVVPQVAGDGASGKIVINRIWFSGASFLISDPSTMAVSEISAPENPDFAGNPLEVAFPDVYRLLHGPPGRRTQIDGGESVLACLVDSALGPGELVTISRQFEAPTNLSHYRNLILFIYRADA